MTYDFLNSINDELTKGKIRILENLLSKMTLEEIEKIPLIKYTIAEINVLDNHCAVISILNPENKDEVINLYLRESFIFRTTCP